MSLTTTEQATPEKGKLRLPSLEIHNFRAFDHLRIEALGRVNLITGQNNVGKTSVLEAVYLFARAGAPRALFELLRSRDEFAGDSAKERPDESLPPSSDRDLASYYPLTIRHLFHGRNDFDDFPEAIRIGPIDDPDETLQMEARLYRVFMETAGEGSPTQRLEPLSAEDLKNSIDAAPYVSVKMGRRPTARYSFALLRSIQAPFLRFSSLAQEKRALLVNATGLENTLISRLWNNVQLSPLEDDVRTALQIVASDVERVSIRIDPGTRQGPTPIVKVKASSHPFPLRTMGDGMVRLFGIALALVNSKDGFLLIDELENGLHYSIQPDVWRLIFRVANRLNVQVLATTHSWDCIEAFQTAAAEAVSEEGTLVRLREKGGKIVATRFDERQLRIVTRDDIEVR